MGGTHVGPKVVSFAAVLLVVQPGFFYDHGNSESNTVGMVVGLVLAAVVVATSSLDGKSATSPNGTIPFSGVIRARQRTSS